MITERIIPRSAGCFLDPPGYPTYTYSVETDLNRHRDHRGWMALTSAASEGWVHTTVRLQAMQLITHWHLHRPHLHSAPVQNWIHRVLGYFRNCYDPEATKQASLYTIDHRDPMKYADIHAGVRFIRRFYPEFVPTPHHFTNAR